MKNLYYIEAEKLAYVHKGERHFSIILDSFEGFQKALWRFQELKFLQSAHGNYKNIVLFRYDGKGHRIYLRQA